MSLSDVLDNRIQGFKNRFGRKHLEPNGKDIREDAVFMVVNEEKPPEKQMPVIVQGSIIDRFVFNGHYKIDLLGYHSTKKVNKAEQRAEENKKSAAAEMEQLRLALSGNAPAPEPAHEPEELSEEDLDRMVEEKFEALKAQDKRRKPK